MAGETASPYVDRQSDLAVVACGLTRHQRAYLLDGTRRSAECRFVDSYDELDRVLLSLTRCDAIVLSPQDSSGRDAVDCVRRLAGEWPDAAIVIFCPPRSDPPPNIRTLALAGAHQFVFEGMYDTASTLARALESARRACAAEVVLRMLQPSIPPELHSVAHAVVARPDVLTSVATVADALGIHRKTLVNRCARSGFLPPAELVLWCRLALVGYLLEKTGSTIESIGLALGFASHTALRNLVKRYVGQRATDIRQGGGLSVVIAALERRLESRAHLTVSREATSTRSA